MRGKWIFGLWITGITGVVSFVGTPIHAGSGTIDVVRASDPFEGLIPGELLTDDELEQYHGKALPITVNFGDDGVITFQGDFSSSADNTSTITGNDGVVQTVPVIGNNNNVDLSVNITVNINTVTVENASGSDISVNQVLDFDGVLSGPFSR